MAQPVWTLSVDLQTKTATFQSGMSDAAKAARGSFQEIKEGANEMGRTTSGSMMEARHSVMLLGEEFGVHLPRGVTMFISSLGPVAGAMEAAFPFLAIAVGAKILLDHLSKVGESGAKVSEAWSKVADVGADAMDHMQEKLTAAEIRSDELAGNHLAALEKKLRQIDHATMRDVISEIGKMGEAADAAFKQSEHGWFMQMLMGHADLGPAKAQLDGYLSEIDKLKNSNAKPEDVLSLVKVDVAKVQADMGTVWNTLAQYRAEDAAKQKAGDAFASAATDSRIQKAQEVWNAEQKVLDALKQQQDAATAGVKSAHLDKGSEQKEYNEKVAEAAQKLAEENKGIAESYGKLQHAVIAYHHAQTEHIEDKSGMEGLRETLKTYSEIVSAAKESAQARLASDREASQEEIAQAKAQEEGALSAIRNAERLGLITKSEAIRDEMDLEEKALTAKINSIEEGARQQIAAYQAEIDAAQRADAAQASLGVHKGDPGYVDYLNQINVLQIKVAESTARASNEEKIATTQTKTALGDLSSSLYTARAAWDALEKSAASTVARSIAEGKSMAQAFGQLGKQMLQAELEHLMEIKTVEGAQRLENARKAATDAWAWAGNPILGAVASAATFAAVMAFETGGIVPGVTKGDTVPAMLTPGEAVLPKRLTENLTHASRSGSSGQEIHVHNHFSPTIHAVDSDGVDKMLEKHKETFHRHFEDHVRKMNH